MRYRMQKHKHINKNAPTTNRRLQTLTIEFAIMQKSAIHWH